MLASTPKDTLFWILGAATFAVVVAASLHVSEATAFVTLIERAEPWWLLLAFALQAGTYAVEGEIWRCVGRRGGFRLSLPDAFRLSLTKLFVDQAIPSAGLSGTLVVAKTLAQRGVSRPTITAGVIVRTVSYYAAYALTLGAALVSAIAHGQASGLIAVISVVFLTFAALFSVAALALTGRGAGRWSRHIARFALLRSGLALLQEADPTLARDGALLARASLLQLCIVLLDATTMWALIEALDTDATPWSVFASFMISTLFRSIGILPGGLGSFEAASVVTLKVVGIPIPVALSATLLFRGFSFWLPMLPGFWCSRAGLHHAGETPSLRAPEHFWTLGVAEVLAALHTDERGLTRAEAMRRLARHGPNVLREQRVSARTAVLLRQARNPLLLILIFAAVVSIASGEWTDAAIVLLIVGATLGVGYRREYKAQSAIAALRVRVSLRARVIRDGQDVAIPVETIVPGDVVLLGAGSLVPADALILEATDCFVSEAALTGESFPVRKQPGPLPPSTPLARRTNCVYLGTNVRSGMARCLVVGTGAATEFGNIAHRLALRPPDTEFERGLLRFGYLLASAMFLMVLVVFGVHVIMERPPIETLLFSIALAVGLSPELLPAILSVNLARGAELMAGHGVLVRRLNGIENLGSMDVLCTDKTGTLTEGVVRLEGAFDPGGAVSAEVLALGALNAALETGLRNPLDEAILQARAPDLAGISKLAEIPFDFVRKRISVVIRDRGAVRLVTKGEFHQVMRVCIATPTGRLDAAARADLEQRHGQWSAAGIRVLAVATRELSEQAEYHRDCEIELTFRGFLAFLDHPKEGVREALAGLDRLGVAVKLITGDTRLVAEHVARLVGLRAERVVTGSELDDLKDEALWRAAEQTDLFVEVDPNQKERIILALRKMGHVVGFLGDGVNDAPAMHAADTSLSVAQAVDVAREAADFVLLERHLEVIRRGIEEGRRTFANTLKYVLTTTSANLGNMLSMAVVSLFLPFLPLLAGQILLNNFLSDIPAVGIADDSVDPELIARPRRWNMTFIGRFMIEFGLLSSAFDFLTFAILLGVFQAAPELFRTGWFVESLLTELVIALVVRTRRPFFRSRPGPVLMASTAALSAVALVLPFLPFANLAGFVPLPPSLLFTLVAITAAYVVAAEITKRWFYREAR